MGLERSQALHFCFCFLPKFLRQLNSEQPVSLLSCNLLHLPGDIWDFFFPRPSLTRPRAPWGLGLCLRHPDTPPPISQDPQEHKCLWDYLKSLWECYQRHKGVQDFAFLDNNIGPRLFKPEGAVGTKLLEDLIWKTQQRQKRLKHC